MRRRFAPPRTIRRVAARRVFQVSGRKDVVLTLGVPRPVPGSDWGCAVQITGLKAGWSRPRYVFGIDGLQALHLAMKYAAGVLESSGVELIFLGRKGDLGMPRFLPDLPEPQRARIEALIERQLAMFVAAAERRQRKEASRQRRRRS